jgi:hypothetical protein
MLKRSRQARRIFLDRMLVGAEDHALAAGVEDERFEISGAIVE